MKDISFFSGKRVLITGNTGFKGSWLSRILINAGANVYGYSLYLEDEHRLYDILDLDDEMFTYKMDIRNKSDLEKCFCETKPDIVFHLAAQPIVRESYKNPVGTYETNVMGTVNLLECIRNTKSVRSVVNVTTDKVYHNKEWEWGYRENETLDGYDPYSNSKSCSELVTASYKRSFLDEMGIAVSTARAGNVIGGGDFSVDRIVPDCIRAARNKKNIIVRNPFSVRPYQHVLEPLFAYLLIAQKQWEDCRCADNYNVGPDEMDCITTGALVTSFCNNWGEDIKWEAQLIDGPHEASFLKLDCSKIKSKLGWKTTWNVEKAIRKTIEWEKFFMQKEDMKQVTKKQIEEFMNEVF